MSDNYRSRRLSNHDYQTPGWYFITICTHHRLHFFGKIKEGIMELSDVGKVAHDYWLEIPQHSRFAEVGAFVIMSNHMHGLLRIVGNPPSRNMTLENTESDSVHYHHAISPSKGSVSQIVRGYKSAVTRVVRSFYQDFAWQSSFHDHIVREGEFDRIEQYILNNAKNWEEDGFYSAGMPE